MTDRERVTREDYETLALNQHAHLQDILCRMRALDGHDLWNSAIQTPGLLAALTAIQECPEPSK